MTEDGAPREGAPLPEGLAGFRRALSYIGVAELWLSSIAFAAVVCLTIVQVTLRYVFQESLWWGQEVAQLMILIAYFLGIAYVFKTRQYVIVSFLADRLPPRAQIGCYLLAQALTVILAGVVVVEFILIAPRQYVMLTYILHIPRFYLALPLFLGSLSMIATSIYYALAVQYAARGHRQAGVADLEAALLVNRPVGEI